VQFPVEIPIRSRLLSELLKCADGHAALVLERHESKVELRDDLEAGLVEAAIDRALAAIETALPEARSARRGGHPRIYVQLQHRRRELTALQERLRE